MWTVLPRRPSGPPSCGLTRRTLFHTHVILADFIHGFRFADQDFILPLFSVRVCSTGGYRSPTRRAVIGWVNPGATGLIGLPLFIVPCPHLWIRTRFSVGTVGCFRYYHLEHIGRDVIFLRAGPSCLTGCPFPWSAGQTMGFAMIRGFITTPITLAVLVMNQARTALGAMRPTPRHHHRPRSMHRCPRSHPRVRRR